MPAASIVVPSRGGVHRLPTLFASMQRQSTDDFEVTVVLDEDIDSSAALIDSWSDRIPVRSITFAENRGRASALNAGFYSSKGEVFIRCDDDLELEPDFVEHHVRLHREGSQGVIAMCRDVFPEGSAFARAIGHETDEKNIEAAFATPPELTWRWWSGNVSTTADDFHRVGGYDESFRKYGWEDIEWGYRLHRSGRDIIIAPGFSTLHHGPVTSMVEKTRRALQSGESYRLFTAKHGAESETDAPLDKSLWNRLVRASAS